MLSIGHTLALSVVNITSLSIVLCALVIWVNGVRSNELDLFHDEFSISILVHNAIFKR